VSGVQTMHRIFVRGRVQGVGYRAWVEDQATLRGLAGFVRNRRDGSVEALFAGPAETVAGMVAACRRGPPSAEVTHVEDAEADASLLGQRRRGEVFSVLPTL
jgi:acylphosphatase